MIRITIHSGEARTVNYISKKTGQPATLHTQTAYAHIVNENGEPVPYPEKFDIFLRDKQPPYAPGDYTLHPSALYLNDQGRLSVAPRLVPVKAKA